MSGSAVPLDERVVDMWGLAYPIGAHMELASRTVWPGHEKGIDVVWIFAEYAEPNAPLPPTIDSGAVAAARHALSCGDLKELQDSVQKPMAPGQFWRNIVGAAHRTELRIPRDPHQAARRFCGTAKQPAKPASSPGWSSSP